MRVGDWSFGYDTKLQAAPAMRFIRKAYYKASLGVNRAPWKVYLKAADMLEKVGL